VIDRLDYAVPESILEFSDFWRVKKDMLPAVLYSIAPKTRTYPLAVDARVMEDALSSSSSVSSLKDLYHG
jgi:hypothetical protein